MAKRVCPGDCKSLGRDKMWSIKQGSHSVPICWKGKSRVRLPEMPDGQAERRRACIREGWYEAREGKAGER